MEIATTSVVALILVCITAYFIMTKDTRLKERELKMIREVLQVILMFLSVQFVVN